MIRTFIAIELPPPVTTALMQVQSRLKTISPPHAVRWTAPQNIHLTLHFLGDIPDSDVTTVSNALDAVAADCHPFELSLGGLGCFPNYRRPRVLWVGALQQSDPLTALHQKLGAALQAAIGFAPETRPFSPHLTLGRVKSGIPGRHLRQLSEAISAQQKTVGQLARLPVTQISFIKSELRPTGAIYAHLSRHPFNEA
jgi:2'-5' RNA ligase